METESYNFLLKLPIASFKKVQIPEISLLRNYTNQTVPDIFLFQR